MTHTAVLHLFRDRELVNSVSFSSEDTPIVIGRDPRAHLCLDQEKVSRQHATVDFDGSEYWLEDLSTNGTFLNDTPIERAALQNGDAVRIGDFVITVTVPQSRASDRRVDADVDIIETIPTPREGS